MLRAMFITMDDEFGLSVAFGIEPHAQDSLIVSRSEHLEHILDPEQRGATVTYTKQGDEPYNVLVALRWVGSTIDIKAARCTFQVDVSKVDDEEISEAKRFLALMNTDNKFELAVA
jgi:hypothetical protein